MLLWWHQHFFFFLIIFLLFFSDRGTQRKEPQEGSTQTEVKRSVGKFAKFHRKCYFQLQRPFSIFFWFFLNFCRGHTGRSQVWVTSTLSQESAEKISDRSELRAKSYVRFTEGMSRYVIGGWEIESVMESVGFFFSQRNCGCGGWLKSRSRSIRWRWKHDDSGDETDQKGWWKCGGGSVVMVRCSGNNHKLKSNTN